VNIKLSGIAFILRQVSSVAEEGLARLRLASLSIEASGSIILQ